MASPDGDKKEGGGFDDLFDEILAEDMDGDNKLAAFADLERLTMNEVSSEIEAVLDDLRTRQGY